MKEISFKTFLENTEYQYSDLEIANLYFSQPDIKVEELARTTSKSIAELYQIIHSYGKPNRMKIGYENVLSLADSGTPVAKIAEIVGYTPRHIRNIIKQRNDNTK